MTRKGSEHKGTVAGKGKKPMGFSQDDMKIKEIVRAYP